MAATGISRLQREGDVDYFYSGMIMLEQDSTQLTLTVQGGGGGEKWILALSRKKT